ncbi:MAG: sugar transferase, partial [Myxococcota bacterium]
MSTRPENVFDLTGGEIPDARIYELATRVYNVIAAAIGLLLLSPLLLIAAVLIKASSRGTIFYRGKRVGRNEEIFTIYKFRTLEQGAENQIGARLLRDGEDQVTPVGRILRKRKIDEFPQLINVLRGDMNLVGPRPVRPVFLEQAKRDIPGYAGRFRIPPGITGLAQLRHSYYLSPRNKLRYERVYMRNRSILFDLWIMLLTFTRLLSRQMTTLSLVLLLVVFALFLPETVSEQLHMEVFGRSVNLINLAILGMGIFFVLRYLRGDLVFLKTPVDRVVMAFLVVASGSILLQASSGPALVQLAKFACTGFGLYYFVANSVNDRVDDMKIYMKGIAIIAFISGLAGIVGFLLLRGEVRSEALRAGLDAQLVKDFLTNRNVLISYFVLCLPVLLAATRSFVSLTRKTAGLVCFAASLGFAATFFSKRGMMVLGFTLLLYG